MGGLIGPLLLRLGIIYALILIGVALRRLIPSVDRLTKMLSLLLVNLLMPVVILSSIIRFSEAFSDYRIALFSASIFFLSFVLAYFLFGTFKGKGIDVGPYILASINPNGFYLPFPIVYALFDVEGLSYSTVYLLIASVANAFWVYPLYSLYSSKNRSEETSLAKRILLFPPFIASIFGFILLSLGFTLPEQFMQPASYFGQFVTYLALIFVGLNITAGTESWLSKPIFGVVAVRLLLLPLTIFGLMGSLGLKEGWSAVIIIHAGMPPAVNNIILADHFGLDKKLMAKIVTETTALTLLTLPLLIILGQRL